MYDFFSDFFDGFDLFPEIAVRKETPVCPSCGRSYYDFQKTGKLGCGKCYDAFRPLMQQTLKQIHANPVHTGKIPLRCEGKLKRERLYESLKQQLSEAVRQEDYEKAAKLHKQIREIESEGQS